MTQHSKDAQRYEKLRHWISSNVTGGWNEVCNLAAIATYQGFEEFDAYLDSLPECNVGLCQKGSNHEQTN